jgi:hypothetical protein
VQRKKLDGKSTKCILIGVSEESKAYKLYNPAERKIIVSRDVIFEELKGWDWGKKTSTKELIDVEENDEAQGQQDETEVGNEVEDNINADNADGNQDNYDSGSDSTEELPPRARQPPSYLRDYVTNLENQSDMEQHFALFSSKEDPDSYDEAVKHEIWRKAMESEIESIKRNDTWELTELPHGVRPIGVKWIFKTKYNEAGKIEKHKARLVAKGYA